MCNLIPGDPKAHSLRARRGNGTPSRIIDYIDTSSTALSTASLEKHILQTPRNQPHRMTVDQLTKEIEAALPTRDRMPTAIKAQIFQIEAVKTQCSY